MRFDFIPNFNIGVNIPWNRTLEMFREQTSLVEQADFTTVWFTEHHFAHNGFINAPPNPIQVCTHIGAHFKKIRVGTCPVVLPDWHPLRVAEDIAMLDNMTLGRVDFGVAKGINERQTLQFNENADRRKNDKVMRLFEESLDIVLKAWDNEVFKYKGEFYEFPVPNWKETNRYFQPFDKRYHNSDGEYKAMYVHPRPFQSPNIPIWLMSNAPSTFKTAGSNGWGVISMATTPQRTLACWQPYREEISKFRGFEAKIGEGVGVCFSFYVGESQKEAEDTVRPAINAYYEMLGGSRPLGEWTKHGYLDIGEEMSDSDDALDWFDFLNARGIIVVGDANYVIERFHRCRESYGLDHVVCMQQFVNVPYHKLISSLARFIEHVVPYFGTKSIEQLKDKKNA